VLRLVLRPIRFEDSIRKRIGRPIRFEIRFERKKMIRRSLPYSLQQAHNKLNCCVALFTVKLRIWKTPISMKDFFVCDSWRSLKVIGRRQRGLVFSVKSCTKFCKALYLKQSPHQNRQRIGLHYLLSVFWSLWKAITPAVLPLISPGDCTRTV